VFRKAIPLVSVDSADSPGHPSVLSSFAASALPTSLTDAPLERIEYDVLLPVYDEIGLAREGPSHRCLIRPGVRASCLG
jgi:hypothetical protein